MGKGPAFVENDFQNNCSSGFHLKSKGCETAVDVSNKTYVINANSGTIGIRIFDKSSREWVTPMVLGTKPKSSEGHSAILLDEHRILVTRGNSKADDCFWFLEIDTAFVREKKGKLGTEVVAWSKGVALEQEKPIVISGPSGVGKGTLISKLKEEFPSMFEISVSHTTRAPRNYEQNGVDYHFTERSVMEKDIEDGKFLEFAEYADNLYGTSVEAVEVVTDIGKRCILDIDVQGATSVRASSLEPIFVFIRPPSFEELEKRLRARGTETEEDMQKRLRNAKAELEQGTSPGLYDHILVNADLESCYENLKKLLGLNNGVKTQEPGPDLFDVPLEHTISRIDQKILINCGGGKQGKTTTNMFVLDLSSIKGGAPGKTRGLSICPAEQSMNYTVGSRIPT